MIRTQSLSKSFRTAEIETRALHKLNLSIEAGEFVAIMGPSGCGKSTLLHQLGMLSRPSSGQYFFQGQAVHDWPEEQRLLCRRDKIGFVFQQFHLIQSLSVYENIEMPLAYLRVPAKVRKKRILDTLEHLHLGHRRKHFPRQLSGGQQQRVAMARAVVTQPALLLVDEPTGNLDAQSGLQVMRLLTQLNRSGTTIVMVTHSDHDAAFAHRILQMLDGQLFSSNVGDFSFSPSFPISS